MSNPEKYSISSAVYWIMVMMVLKITGIYREII